MPRIDSLFRILATGLSLMLSPLAMSEAPPAAPFSVDAAPTRGLAPLDVTFDFSYAANLSLRALRFDFEGDGTADLSLPIAVAGVIRTYSAPGVYPATVTLEDTTGQTYTQPVQIVVYDATAMDALFRNTWNGMNNALKAGDLETGKRYLSAKAKQLYAPAFETLRTQWTAIVGSYSSLQRVSIGADTAEYAVNRVINGVNQIYLIQFVRDTDGVWRIAGM